MNSTALGAENIIFISEAHEKFFHEKLKEVRYLVLAKYVKIDKKMKKLERVLLTGG